MAYYRDSAVQLRGHFAQRQLDKVTERIEEGQQMVSLHNIYCPCERCVEVRAIEKERRDKN